MNKEMKYLSTCRRDQGLLLLFGASVLLIVTFVIRQVISAAPEFASIVIAAAVLILGTLCGILIHMGIFLKKNLALVYGTELSQVDEKQEEH